MGTLADFPDVADGLGRLRQDGDRPEIVLPAMDFLFRRPPPHADLHATRLRQVDPRPELRDDDT